MELLIFILGILGAGLFACAAIDSASTGRGSDFAKRMLDTLDDDD